MNDNRKICQIFFRDLFVNETNMKCTIKGIQKKMLLGRNKSDHSHVSSFPKEEV